MTRENKLAAIKQGIGTFIDFPKKGIIFRDIFPILQQPNLFADVISLFEEFIVKHSPDVQAIAGIEARGFLFGPSLALKLNIPFIPIRKPGKLPGNVIKEQYSLEYGTDVLEIQKDNLKPGSNIVIVDDLLATGGSMGAAVKLVQNAGAIVKFCLVVMELDELNGRENISAPLHALVNF